VAHQVDTQSEYLLVFEDFQVGVITEENCTKDGMMLGRIEFEERVKKKAGWEPLM
jgi:hypothetical protein